MAASALSIVTPKSETVKPFNPRPFIVCRSSASSSSPSSISISCRNSTAPNNKKPLFEVGIGLLAASLLVSSPLNANATRLNYYATVAEPPCEFKFAPSGLGYCDLAVGSREEAPYNELINIHYTGRFADGTVFDSSYKFARPLTMRIGVGKVIKGLDQGIFGGEGVPPMLVGGKRKLQIPPELAYGPEPAGCFSGDCNIPANATSFMTSTLSIFIKEIENEGFPLYIYK